jgi:hypothetical protein
VSDFGDLGHQPLSVDGSEVAHANIADTFRPGRFFKSQPASRGHVFVLSLGRAVPPSGHAQCVFIQGRCRFKKETMRGFPRSPSRPNHGYSRPKIFGHHAGDRVKATLLIFFLVTGIFAGVQFKQRRNLEERAATAAHTLHHIYVLTPNQILRIVDANSWMANVCMEYVADDAREQSFIRYAVFEKNSKFVNYDLYQEDIEAKCSMAGVDLAKVMEEELKDESEDAKR